MTPYKAIQHIHYKLSNVWKPTPKDVEAFDVLRDYVANEHTKQYHHNEKFAKLYIFAFAYFIKQYETTVFDSLPQKKVNEFLATPLKSIIERFTHSLNESDRYALLSEVLPNKHPLMYSAEERKEAVSRLGEILKNPDNELTNEVWDFDTVADNLEAMINNALDL